MRLKVCMFLQINRLSQEETVAELAECPIQKILFKVLGIDEDTFVFK